nr:EOG090X09KD [Lepidurus arcticus]
MPCWYYDKKDLRNTPSIQAGLDYETECRYRREGARFIIDVGTKMGLRYDTMATGVVYFHRFYMFHTFQEFPRYITACCCLFLAGKVEETPKKCKDIIKAAKGLLSDAHYNQFGADPKEEVMTMERILLQTIQFDLQVEHPYRYLILYAKCLRGDKVKLQKMVQMAWTFVNDSLCTTLCLQWEPEIIGIALIYLAGKLSKFEVQDWKDKQPRHLRWWDAFVEDITLDILEDTCHQVLDLYSQSQTSRPDSPLLNVSTAAITGAVSSLPTSSQHASSNILPPPPPLVSTTDVGAPLLKLDNPGTMEDLHKKCKDVFPANFEGAKLLINKGLSNHFQISHTLNMSSVTPSGYRFGATYVGTRQFGPGEAYPILLGDIDPSGNLNANIIHQLSSNLRCKFVAQAIFLSTNV